MGMQQGQVLLDLITEYNVKRFAEIGIWKSDTVKTILNNKPNCLEEYWAIDPWLRKNDLAYGHYCTQTQEEWDELYFTCCKLMLNSSVLRVFRMNHEKASMLFPEQYFNLVFLDTDHFFEPACSEIDYWLPLVKTGGLLTGHDYISRTPGVKMAVQLKFGDDYELLRSTMWMHRKKINGNTH